jgi:hypothetical protein
MPIVAADVKQRKENNMSKEQGAHSSGKPTEPREGDGWHCGRKTPKASKVTTLSLENDNDKVRKDAVEKQNTSLTSDGTRLLNVLSNSGKAVNTHAKGGE